MGVLNNRLDPTPFAGVRLQPGRTSFRSSSKNAVIGGISSLQYVFLQKCNFATGIFAITKNTRAKLHCQIQSSVCPQSGAEYSCLKLKTLI